MEEKPDRTVSVQRRDGEPWLIAKRSEPADDNGVFPENSKIMSWALVMNRPLYRCPKCKSPRIRPSKILNTRKNGTRWWVCGNCSKNSNALEIEKDRAIISDLMYITTLPEYRGHGYAQVVLEVAKKMCHRLYTQISASSPEGIATCKKAGMVERGDALVWEQEGYEVQFKEKKDAEKK